MTPLKWFLSIASLVALAIVGVQWNALSKLRQENQTLRAAALEAEIAGQSSDLELLHLQDEELAQWRDAAKALARTRNEVRQLRGQKPELEKLRAANQRLAAANQAGTNSSATYITGALLKDAGFSTPEAACQTVFFALRSGDMRRVADCMAPEAREWQGLAQRSEQELAEMGREMREEFMKFPGFRIVGKNSISDEEVEITLQSTPGGELMKIPLRRYGAEWKLVRFL